MKGGRWSFVYSFGTYPMNHQKLPTYMYTCRRVEVYQAIKNESSQSKTTGIDYFK